MKFTFIAAVIMTAATASAADWAPSIDLKSAAAVEVPAPAAPSRAIPRDGANYSGAEEMLIKEFGITGITLDVPESDVIEQQAWYGNAVSFDMAFRRALNSVLADRAEGSALSDVLRDIGVNGAPTKTEAKKARAELLSRLNDASSLIAIVRPYRHYQPAKGEKVEQNWIFYLRIGGRSYWAVVDRSGKKDDYNYGAA